MSTLIKLPDERFAQLQDLAESEEMPMADLVGLLIRVFQKSRGLPASVPGFKISRSDDGKVIFEIEAIDLKRTWSVDVARSVANVLETYSASGKSPGTILDMDADILISRRGTSVKISNPYNSKTVTLARSIARELTDLLRDAINGGAGLV